MLLHIVFYAKIGDEKGEFDIKDVCDSLCDKLIFRHPHVFGTAEADTAGKVEQNWEQLKLKEKGGNKTVLGGVPASLPSIVKAHRIQDKARNIGFDWEEREQVWDKVNEEFNELKAEINNMEYTPVILFAFNRPEGLKAIIESLLQNEEAKHSVLYVFVDGPRFQRKGEVENVEKVRDYVKSITGFKEVHYKFALQNKGLGNSVIKGVTEVINRYGKAIVLEDDLILAPNFLFFMNQGLDKYKEETSVFSICGYSNKVKVPKDYSYDTYFCTRSSSWGWATWADRWNSVDWELENFDKYHILKKEFNRWGGSDCWKMLNDWKCGRNKSWAIRFCFAQFLQKKVSLFPVTSKVQNDGFDGKGTNCKRWSRFHCIFDNSAKKEFTYPENVSIHPSLFRSAIGYHSIIKRIFSRIIYFVYRF